MMVRIGHLEFPSRKDTVTGTDAWEHPLRPARADPLIRQAMSITTDEFNMVATICPVEVIDL
jgi:hypothetical protein